MAGLFSLREPAYAGDWTTSSTVPRPYYGYEVWAGADAAAGNWSAYGGAVASLFDDIRADGFRVRTSGGYGRYSYARPAFDPFRNRVVSVEFQGAMTFADALVGYQITVGPAVIKAYAGVTQETHVVGPAADAILRYDDENQVQGDRIGFKGALETWISLRDWGFLQTDLNWSQPFQSYGGRLRLGYRINPAWSTGVEAAAFGNINHDRGRTGAFVRFEWTGGEASLSAGADGDTKGVDGAYGSIGALLRF